VYNAVFWLNCVPHSGGIDPTLSSRTINKLQFGTYVQVHEQHNKSLMPSTVGAIALHPSGNAQGNVFDTQGKF